MILVAVQERGGVDAQRIGDVGFGSHLVGQQFLGLERIDLAGVGGVFVLGGLAILGGPALFNINTTQSMTFGLGRLFSPDPQFLLAAAIFGLTPNLLIKELQQKAQEYESDLKSSKGAETQAGSTKH